MKRPLLLFIFILCLVPLYSQSQFYFTDLSGVTTSDNNVHLIYRYHEPYDSVGFGYYNNIILWSLLDNNEKLLDQEFSLPCSCGVYGKSIIDYQFYNNDTSMFYTGGSYSDGDLGSPTIFLNSNYLINVWGGIVVSNMEISHQSERRIYASSENANMFYLSFDSSLSQWQIFEREFYYKLAGISPYDDRIVFAYYFDHPNRKIHLAKSVDRGLTFTLVTENIAPYPGHAYRYENQNFYVDSDSLHIYCFIDNNLFISGDGGDNWINRQFSLTNFSLDYITPGNMFLANNTEIFTSSDFGMTIDSFASIPDSIVGIYNKPGESLVYAATKHAIYEITSDSIKIIKTIQALGINSPTGAVPIAFDLFQNYPNPFNSTTHIPFRLRNNGVISLKIYNSLGQLVSVPIINKLFSSGHHSIEIDASGLQSGIYFYQLSDNKNFIAKSMILVK